MVKRTLYFGNPAYLNTRDEQLVLNIPGAKGMDDASQMNTVPIEDIGVVILDHQQITITHALMAKLLANNVAFITCDESHHPTGLMLNLCGHSLQSARFRVQVEASEPLKKQLWQQTIRAKINNQALHLKKRNLNHENLVRWAKEVKRGDSERQEAKAAAYYWKHIFTGSYDGFKGLEGFTRYREGPPPNQLLNYGYSLLRATVARSLVGSGLMPTLGIFHRNQYNAYCLADDVMEPYRPCVDQAIYNIIANGEDFTSVTVSLKKQLLSIPQQDVLMDGERSPLMVAVQRTTSSLAQCYEGKSKKVLYPDLL